MHTVPGAFQKLQQLYAEGEAAIAARDFETAVAKFTEGIAIDDHFRQRYITMYAQRATAYLRMNDFANAVPDIDKALEMEPPHHHANYYFQRALCAWAGDKDEARALADLGRAIESDSSFWMPYDLRGRIHFAAGRAAEAARDFECVLERQPSEGARTMLEQARAMLS